MATSHSLPQPESRVSDWVPQCSRGNQEPKSTATLQSFRLPLLRGLSVTRSLCRNFRVSRTMSGHVLPLHRRPSSPLPFLLSPRCSPPQSPRHPHASSPASGSLLVSSLRGRFRL